MSGMLSGKTALVTGASRGIGRAVALRLAKEGARVAAIYHGNEEMARSLEAESGGMITAYRCDVADFSSSEETVKKVIADLGGVDILVNNAGITCDKLLLAMSEEDFDSVLDTNLKGAFNMIRHTYKNFMKKKSGRIINVSSVSGLFGNPGQANYSAAKAGLIGLTKTVAKELASRNVTCNAIAPGFIKTDMTRDFEGNEDVLSSIPLKRMGEPDEVADLVLFLSRADYITGEVIRIDGGIAM